MLLSEYLTAFPLDSRLEKIANALTGNEYGSSNDRIGMLALKEAESAYSSGLENFNFKTGSYWNLFETAFADAINKVSLNAPVTSIDYSGNQVLVKTNNGTEYQADRVLVTVPLAMLKNNSIGFVPAIPNNKIQAISKIDMGIGIKITLQFTAPFWIAGTSSIIGGVKVPEYWITSNGKDTGFSYITAFLMGSFAEELALLSQQQAVQEIISELAAIFPTGGVTGKYTGSFVYKNWADEPYIGGAYSFPSITSTGQREILALPINSKVFFAGEATNYNGHLATVHGAMESGFRAVKEILQA
jgi:monoamine oxidase